MVTWSKRGIELNIFWWQVYLGFPLRDNDPSKNIILPLTATSPLSQKEKKHLTMIFFLPFSMLLLCRHRFALLGQLFFILQSGNVRASQFYRVWFRKSPHTLLWMVPSYHCLPYRQRFIKKLLVAGIEPRLRVSKQMLEPLHHPLRPWYSLANYQLILIKGWRCEGALRTKMIKKSVLEGIGEYNIIFHISSEPGGGQTSDPLRATIHLP